MGKMTENPRYNVVSLRISDEERQDIRAVEEQTRKSVSQILREALSLYRRATSPASPCAACGVKE